MLQIEQKILDNYQSISDIEIALGTMKLLPDRSDIPKEFEFMGKTKWNKLFSDMFFSGLTELDIVPKEGIDANDALKCIRAHMGSWEPQQEHKEAGVAYMMSILLEDATWKVKE